eukprot:TRINITY_DN64914_c0_g1_i1.p1 TRINITY_DN64914_c0_g1~~TRINITY_DN64914_c0_g1_i1.p1  ORF type:complete len:211 (-),score=25.37 TRINITY_DN64914_c0_g1_i1:246-878(-)
MERNDAQSSLQPVLPQDLPAPDERSSHSTSASAGSKLDTEKGSAPLRLSQVNWGSAHVVWGRTEKPETLAGYVGTNSSGSSPPSAQPAGSGTCFVASTSSSGDVKNGAGSSSVLPAQDSGDDKRPHSGGQWSEGAAQHAVKKCKPCGYAWRPGGCQNGASCAFCHLCEDGVIQRQRKVRLRALRAKKRALNAALKLRQDEKVQDSSSSDG